MASEASIRASNYLAPFGHQDALQAIGGGSAIIIIALEISFSGLCVPYTTITKKIVEFQEIKLIAFHFLVLLIF